MRPRFFAGQLLTEDDLSALIDYVVAKNRFHNSRLFGQGVVCGLLVECGPCDGQIVVDPGYALDCCGNDLVLTCKQTLDMAPMIRALAKKGDCGCTDPCSDPAIAKTASQGKDELTTRDEQTKVKPCKHYYLYARYAERPDQPVATYPVAGDCDSTSCEPTRVVEGIVFELRCAAKAPDPTMHDAIACCDGKDEGKYLLNVASGLQVVGRALQSSLGDEKALRADEVKQLHEGYHLDDLVSNVHGHDRVVLYARYIATVGTILARASRNKIDLKGIETEHLQKNLALAATELAKANPDELPAIDAALVRAVLPDRTDKIEVRSSRAGLLELNVSDRFM
ncbi:MAG TPA: hypothetical protein VLT45_20565, partial [Kofleriaceae bacterium]|nr:hypothetical protein [Kofleriaceae bacterium]